MKRYVVGFMFDDEIENVCMIVKNRPAWQQGLLNGIGGKSHDGEEPLAAMEREFEEETGVNTRALRWLPVCTLRYSNAGIDVFAANNTSAFQSVETCTDEIIKKIPLAQLSSYDVVENIPPLIELSIQRLQGRPRISPR